MFNRNIRSIAERTDFVFDIETVPDAELCRKVYGEAGMSDAEAIQTALVALGREESGMLPEAFQRPIVIVACALDYRAQTVKPFVFIEGRPKYPDEEALLAAFWRALEPSGDADRLRRIVSFNGKGFDMRVIETRSLQYESISCGTYFKPGEKYDTYRHKFNDEEHLDLVDYLPNYGNKAGFSLRTVASLVGLPGKDVMDGSQVYPVYQEGGIMRIAAYCLEDVIQTALIKIRLDRLRGILDRDEMRRRIAWFLDTMERYLVDQAVPLEPAFQHTLDELCERYRPALLGMADAKMQIAD
jgi:predicted PolB exonuclease-like 3'-5' exonuclease